MPGGYHPPPAVKASWPKPNYRNPPERGAGVNIATGILGTIMLAVVGLRLWVRFGMREPGLDDYIIILALFPAIGLGITLGLTSPLHGWYRHIWDTVPTNFVPIQRFNWISQTFFMFANTLTKISILVLYLRVIRGTANKIFLTIVRVAIAILVLYMVSGISLLSLQCQPLEAYWEQFNFKKPMKGFTCWNEGVLPLYATIFNVTTDLMSNCLPMFLFVQLKMPIREKISLGIVFGVGFIACICGMLRIYYYHQVFYRSYDITWLAYDAWLWTVMECYLAIICASIPPLRPLFKRFLHGTLYARNYRKNGYSSRSKNNASTQEDVENAQSYRLQNTPRLAKSTEWDKDSFSSSAPLEQPRGMKDGIMRTDNFEVKVHKAMG